MATDLTIFPLSRLTEVSSSECPPLPTAWLPGRAEAQVQEQVQVQVQGRWLYTPPAPGCWAPDPRCPRSPGWRSSPTPSPEHSASEKGYFFAVVQLVQGPGPGAMVTWGRAPAHWAPGPPPPPVPWWPLFRVTGHNIVQQRTFSGHYLSFCLILRTDTAPAIPSVVSPASILPLPLVTNFLRFNFS